LEPRIEMPARNVAAELALADELTVDPGLAQVLYARGIRDAESARRFLLPDVATLTPPSDFPDLEQAAAFILEGVRGGEKFFVAGDYDVDGLAATAILVTVLRRLGAAVRYYVPNRLTEGYDLTPATVARAVNAGAQILVTADCGSRAQDAVAAARRAGLAVLVTDHHRLAENLPPADAVVTPHRLPEGHPARGFAGVGVAYKLAEELLRRSGASLEPAALLPLAAVGTVCDVVGLTGENRVLVAAGLRDFPGESFPGLAALLAEGRAEPPVTSWQLAFVVGPRLNAAGRLGHAGYALELLLAEDEERARSLARKLEDFNSRRRALEERVAAAAMEQGGAQVFSGKRSVVLWGEGWHPGVVGIVASRVVEQFYRPAVLVAVEGDAGRGSCRSIPAFDVHDALAALGRHLVRFGGHRLAAGFEIAAGDIPAFAEGFEEYAAAKLDEEALRPAARVDGYLPLGAVNPALTRDLALLEPTGEGNPAATFYARAEVIDEEQRVFKDAHIEVYVGPGRTKIRAIGFNLARDGGKLESGEYGFVYTPTLDRWRERERLELKLAYILPVNAATRGGAEPPKIMDERNGRRGDGESASQSSADAVFALPGQAVGVGARQVITYGDALDARLRFRRLRLAAPPFDAHRFAMLLSASDEVVLAFGAAEAAAAKDFLREFYPDRDMLISLYRRIREDGLWAPEDGDGGGRRAVKVFCELGLTKETAAGVILIDEAEANGERKSLEDSLLFRLSQRRREAAEEFVAALCEWPEADLKEMVRDLLQGGTQPGVATSET
jgi:single-stranded-DNA-specific exonuclease